ncbi:MAG: DNA methyltransferase, partial [Terrimesophilobacter sp.]
MDLFWPGHLIVEMKAPHVPIEKATDQRARYWQASSDSANDVQAARFVMACNFGEFEIWEPGLFPNEARALFPLSELPDRYDSLLFLQSDNVEPIFSEHRRELTTEAATHIAELYNSLADRSAAPADVIQQFTMQVVWCLFAEDLGILDGYPLQNTVDDLLKQKDPDSARDIGYLFSLLNQKGNHNRQGRYLGTHYVNGDLFKRPAAVLLNRGELEHLRGAAEFNWRAVDPTIFGSLMEGVLGEARRDTLGAHYTHESDIMKIVVPTIVRPWRERIAETTSAAEARALLDELCAFRVLDPACGCGNFLYVAYRELRGLEFELKQRMAVLAKKAGVPAPSGPLPFFPLTNLKGIDIEGIAVLIARVVLWMGHRQMIDRYGEAEPVLPLVDLSGIKTADALRTDWPEVDTIIGNPPFLGDRRIRSQLGDAYVEWLKKAFPVGVVDFSAYWFRLAAERLKPGQRAGLVSTNTLRENKHRLASLDYLVERGGVITDAVSSQQWPGDANVHVSITNWVHQPTQPPSEKFLDGKLVGGITTQLRSGDRSWEPRQLAGNRGQSFLGCQPTGDGFFLDAKSATKLGHDSRNEGRIRQFLTARDIADNPKQSPGRWIIDFGNESLEEASKSPLLLELVRAEVRPKRLGSGRHFERLWWQFAWTRPDMRAAIAKLQRYIAVGAHGKRMLIAWEPTEVLPSNANVVFAFDDDYSMGILLSRAHDAWAWARSSTLETRLRYTPTTVF